MSDDDFSWCDNDDIVAVPEQQSIAVYRSDADYIVIRQRCWLEEDGIITVTPDMLPKLIAALDALAEPATDTRNQPTASARRQQRYRERQRNDSVTPTVTHRNAETVTPVTARAAACVVGSAVQRSS
jgi:hypothetical protein